MTFNPSSRVIPHQLQQSNITGHRRNRTLTSSLFLMILFTQSTAVLNKYLNDELKIPFP